MINFDSQPRSNGHVNSGLEMSKPGDCHVSSEKTSADVDGVNTEEIKLCISKCYSDFGLKMLFRPITWYE